MPSAIFPSDDRSGMQHLLRSRSSSRVAGGSGKSTKSSPVHKIDNLTLSQWNEKYTQLDEILTFAHSYFSSKLVQVSSFGPSGMVLLDRFQKLGLLAQVPVITIDTLHLFPETYEFWNRTIRNRYPNMRLHVYKPDGFDSTQEFDETYGQHLWKLNPDKYAYLTKIEPTERALNDFQASAWITGRRRSQGGERTQMNVFELDPACAADDDYPRIKINPLATWSYSQVWDYIRVHRVPYNPLHDRGYKSIGDVMSTTTVSPDAPERAGRFVGLNQTECGMHAHLEKVQQMKKEAMEGNGHELESPTLECEECIDVDSTTFKKVVLQGEAKVILLEFYSPFCGACQEFAPTFHELVQRLKLKHATDEVQVVRFDMTYSDIPKAAHRAGFVVEATPQLYVVQRNPFRIAAYKGLYDLDSIYNWLRKELNWT
jgi:phosphoadenosine phosphosulfate reductase